MIRPHRTKAKSTSVGFISFDPEIKDLMGELDPNPVGFSVVQVAGNRFEFIELIEMICLPLDRYKLINFIFDMAEQWPLPEVYVDEIPTMLSYTWLNGNRMYSDMKKARQALSTTLYPRLNPYVLRNKSAQTRQRDQLSHRLTIKPGMKTPELIVNEDLEVEFNNALLAVGKHAGLDAAAGAVEMGAKLQQRLRRQFTQEQLENAPTMIAFT